MIHLNFEKPNLEQPNPNSKEAAKARQDEIDKAKEAYFKSGGKVDKV